MHWESFKETKNIYLYYCFRYRLYTVIAVFLFAILIYIVCIADQKKICMYNGLDMGAEFFVVEPNSNNFGRKKIFFLAQFNNRNYSFFWTHLEHQACPKSNWSHSFDYISEHIIAKTGWNGLWSNIALLFCARVQYSKIISNDAKSNPFLAYLMFSTS